MTYSHRSAHEIRDEIDRREKNLDQLRQVLAATQQDNDLVTLTRDVADLQEGLIGALKDIAVFVDERERELRRRP